AANAPSCMGGPAVATPAATRRARARPGRAGPRSAARVRSERAPLGERRRHGRSRGRARPLEPRHALTVIMLSARLQRSGGVTPEAAARLLATLGDLGVGQQGGDGDPVIVLFESDAGLARLVRSCSQGGAVRLIAASLGASPLPQALTWGLLEAGAGDVVHASAAGGAQTIAARLRRWHEIDTEMRSPQIGAHLVGSSAS